MLYCNCFMFSISGPGWVIQNLEAVIFDKDGTIADIHPYWGEIIRRRAQAVIAHYQLSDSLFTPLCASMGLSLPDNRLLPEGPVGLASRDEVMQALRNCLAALGVTTSADTMAALFTQVHEAFLPEMDRYLQLIPGTTEFFAGLRRAGAKMAVVTSDTEVHTRQVLAKLGVGGYFGVIVGRDTTPEPKVSGVPARRALNELGGRADRTVCVGDAPMDFVMAKQSGCLAGIGVATGQVQADELNKYTPYVARSMNDLKAKILAEVN
jgi:phosphoglycolate phosphatase-like HAD superfamily hydrolase